MVVERRELAAKTAKTLSIESAKESVASSLAKHAHLQKNKTTQNRTLHR